MNLPTILKDKEDFKQPVFEDEVSGPLIKLNSPNLTAASEETTFIQKFGKKIMTNLLIFVGGWLLFASSSVFCYIFVFNLSLYNDYLLKPFVAFITGLAFSF